MAYDSFQFGETASTPFAPLLWPIKMTIPLGALLILLQGLAKFLRDLKLVISGALPEKEEGHGH
jgi:TRAP-type mannitol/chloroaromatic compound transport system permease small subunit